MRIMIGILSIIFLSMVLGIVSGFRFIEMRTKSATRLSDKISDSIENIVRGSAMLNLTEERYLSTKDEEFLKAHAAQLASLGKELQEMSDRRNEYPSVAAKIKKIQELLHEHVSQFKEEIALIEAEGSADTGYLGKVRKTVHEAEKLIGEVKNQDRPALEISYLQMRRHEKDYLARREVKYLQKLDEEIGKLKDFLSSHYGLGKRSRETLLSLFVEYSKLLNDLHLNYQKAQEVRSKMLKSASDIEVEIAQIHGLKEKDLAKTLGEIDVVRNEVYVAVLVFTLLGIAVGFLIVKNIDKTILVIEEATKDVGSASKASYDTAATLQSIATKTSDAVSSSSAAIQETVATLNEITAMVNRNLENASNATDRADLCMELTRSGQVATAEMLDAMRMIQKGIETMSEEISESVALIAKTGEIIDKIDEHTKFINDVVFQTKMLSFNAAVEAARAGEHGLGFTVVAEEVGKLAQQSGSAAKNIANLIVDSKVAVANIINQVKDRASGWVASGTENATLGLRTAEKCNEVLGEVVEHVNNVRLLMDDAKASAKEQSDGVNNISIAMNELDASTHQNSDMADKTRKHAISLSEGAANLNKAADRIGQILLKKTPED